MNEDISAIEMRVIRDALDEYELETGLKFSLVRNGEADVYVTVSAPDKGRLPASPYVVGCADIPGTRYGCGRYVQHFEMPCAYLSTNDASDLPYQQGVRSPQWVDRAVALGDCGEREDLRELHLPPKPANGRGAASARTPATRTSISFGSSASPRARSAPSRPFRRRRVAPSIERKPLYAPRCDGVDSRHRAAPQGRALGITKAGRRAT